jgi:hypothetical protein
MTILADMSIPLTLVNRIDRRNDIFPNESIQPLPNGLKGSSCRVGFLNSLHLCHVKTMGRIFIANSKFLLKRLYLGMEKEPFPIGGSL